MNKETLGSWRVTISNDEMLNFAVFTGCAYGLIDDANDTLWPCKFLNSTVNISLLKKQWDAWFNSLIEYRSKKVISREAFYFKINIFSPPNFLDFPYLELKQCCIAAYNPFCKWWNMPGGGKNALQYFEEFGSDNLSIYVSEFEHKMNRKVRPFNLHFDLLYTFTSNSLEVNNEYTILVPNKHEFFHRHWWINKLIDIG